MRRLPLISGTIAALALSALPAVAQTPFQPVLTETPTYLVCEGTTKVSQANFVADGADFVTWDDSKPTGSVQAGEGCGNVDTFLTGANTGNPIYDFPMDGTYTGNVTAMTVELHAIDTAGRVFDDAELLVDVAINGKVRATDLAVSAPWVTSATGASESVQFSLTGVNLLTEADLTRSHSVQITVKSRYADSSTANGWVWDTIEVPSGITFNPATLASSRYALQS